MDWFYERKQMVGKWVKLKSRWSRLHIRQAPEENERWDWVLITQMQMKDWSEDAVYMVFT